MHIPFFEALELDDRRLAILYNEAQRQRTLDVVDIATGSNPPKNLNMKIDKAMKVHGHYTEGFYEGELNKLAGSGLIPKAGKDG